MPGRLLLVVASCEGGGLPAQDHLLRLQAFHSAGKLQTSRMVGLLILLTPIQVPNWVNDFQNQKYPNGLFEIFSTVYCKDLI